MKTCTYYKFIGLSKQEYEKIFIIWNLPPKAFSIKKKGCVNHSQDPYHQNSL